MLNLALKSGDGAKIGDDVQIIFESMPSMGRKKIRVEAPKDKNIVRVLVETKEIAML